jgi:G2/mitotic-specific cyclin-B, other
LQVSELIQIVDYAYSRRQILGMEKTILNNMEWNPTVPTMYVFLVRFAKAAGSGDKEVTIYNLVLSSSSETLND